MRDNGIGIDPQYARLVFRIFKRLHTDREYAGTGIGLALCERVVEQAGGRIWVESEGEGQGATFLFRCLRRKATRRHCRMRSERRTTPVRLLLIEDNRGDVVLLLEALAEHDLACELHHIENGEAALDLLERSAVEGVSAPADLVVMDLNIPRANGGEILERMRRIPACDRIPVVVLTSSDNPDDETRMMRLGATRYLRKPTGVDEFFGRVGGTLKELWPG